MDIARFRSSFIRDTSFSVSSVFCLWIPAFAGMTVCVGIYCLSSMSLYNLSSLSFPRKRESIVLLGEKAVLKIRG